MVFVKLFDSLQFYVCACVSLCFVYLVSAKFLVFLMMDFARVTLRDQRRVGKGLVERMRFNLVQMLRYLS